MVPGSSWEVLDLESLESSCEYMKSLGKTLEFTGSSWMTWEVLGGHVIL